MTHPDQVVWRNARIATFSEEDTGCDAGAIVTRGDCIEWVGPEAEMPDCYSRAVRRDLRNQWVTPGLVDCHTHLVFAGNRAPEWNRLLSGATYEEIARSGGGIISTVKATRAASESDLFDQSAPRLECLLREGVTTVEIKSGYSANATPSLSAQLFWRRTRYRRSSRAAATTTSTASSRTGYLCCTVKAWSMRWMFSASASRSTFGSPKKFWRRRMHWGCPRACTRPSYRITAHATWLRSIGRSPAIISNTPTTMTLARCRRQVR